MEDETQNYRKLELETDKLDEATGQDGAATEEGTDSLSAPALQPRRTSKYERRAPQKSEDRNDCNDDWENKIYADERAFINYEQMFQDLPMPDLQEGSVQCCAPGVPHGAQNQGREPCPQAFAGQRPQDRAGEGGQDGFQQPANEAAR